MQKIIIAVLCLFASSVMGQTNYKTIMYRQKRDSVRKEINLHLQKAKILENTSKTLQVAAAISAVASYQIYKDACNGRPMIYIPLTIGLSALTTSWLSDIQYEKAQRTRINFFCKK
jgi:hypothetical protein